LTTGRHLDLNANIYAGVREQKEVRRRGKGEREKGRKGWHEGSWPWMQTDRQGNQRQAVTFSAAG